MSKHFICFLILSFLGYLVIAQQTQSMQLDLEIKKAKLTYDIKKYNTSAGMYKKL
jgi:putative Mn2+ efflux pump MntP